MKVLNFKVALCGLMFAYSTTSCKSNTCGQATVSKLSTDSTEMQLHFKFLRGCTEQEQTTMRVYTHPQLPNSRVTYYEWTKGKINRFLISKDSFFIALDLFEKACYNHTGCGGYGGGTGVYIEKHFNGKKTMFNYCQEGHDEWNGLEYFFGLMGRKLESYPYKN